MVSSATAQWYEVVYVVLSLVAVAMGGRVLWRNVAELRRLRRKRINGARQAATLTAISSDGFRALVAAFLVVVGVSALYAPPNPNAQATVSRWFWVAMAFTLPSLVIVGAIYDERMRTIVKHKIEEAMGIGMATEAKLTLGMDIEQPNPVVGLLRSRKFLLTVLALAQAVVLEYFNVPDAIWQSVMALAGVVIAGIALEDYGEKRAAVPVSPAVDNTALTGEWELTDDEWTTLLARLQPQVKAWLIAEVVPLLVEVADEQAISLQQAAVGNVMPMSPFSRDNPRCICKEHAGDTPGCPVHDAVTGMAGMSTDAG